MITAKPFVLRALVVAILDTGMALAHALAMAGVSVASLQLVAAQTRLGERRATL